MMKKGKIDIKNVEKQSKLKIATISSKTTVVRVREIIEEVTSVPYNQ